MYTTLKLSLMKEKMAQYIDLVFEHMKWNATTTGAKRGDNKVLLVHGKMKGKWISANGKHGDTK